MENYTPLKTLKPKKKLNKFFFITNIILMFIVVGITGYYLRSKLITQQEKAGAEGCNQYDNRRDCVANCSPTKNDGKKYKCTWNNNTQSCHDSQTICGSGGGGGIGTQPGDCDVTREGRCFKFKEDGETHDATYFFCPNMTLSNFQGSGCSENRKVLNDVHEFCFERNCGTEQIDFDNRCFESRIGEEPCGGGSIPTNTPTPTRTPTPTKTPTPTPTRTPTPTKTPTPTVTPTGSITPTVTPTKTPTPTITPTGTISPTVTPTVTPTGTVSPTLTPIPVLCGTKDCDDTTNPCRDGYVCVQANDGSNYCSSPDFVDACVENPSYNACCTAPGAPTATPTEIILAQTTVTSTPVPPVSGAVTIQSILMYFVPLAIIGLGILL